ncbi:hypothetical protein MHYP_G00358880 [Metynnis hypsauchen]
MHQSGPVAPLQRVPHHRCGRAGARRPQRSAWFSMGFRSGDRDGRGKTLILWPHAVSVEKIHITQHHVPVSCRLPPTHPACPPKLNVA